MKKKFEDLDPIAQYILTLLEGDELLSAQDIAKYIAFERKKPQDGNDAWRKYLNPVKQQALFLAKNGYINFVRKGEVVEDISKVKGLVKYKLAKD